MWTSAEPKLFEVSVRHFPGVHGLNIRPRRPRVAPTRPALQPERCARATTWEIIEGGSWAKLTILTHKDKYIFNAHELEHESEPYYNYTLINYAPGTNWTAVYNGDISDPWPGDGSKNFTSGQVNEGGNLHLKGELDMEIDGKVWLVLSNDYDYAGTQMIRWQPTEYLFEYDLLYVK